MALLPRFPRAENAKVLVQQLELDSVGLLIFQRDHPSMRSSFNLIIQEAPPLAFKYAKQKLFA